MNKRFSDRMKVDWYISHFDEVAEYSNRFVEMVNIACEAKETEKEITQRTKCIWTM